MQRDLWKRHAHDVPVAHGSMLTQSGGGENPSHGREPAQAGEIHARQDRKVGPEISRCVGKPDRSESSFILKENFIMLSGSGTTR
jgi:hypothetical protein